MPCQLGSPEGLKIQFRLKHDLNKPATADEPSAAKIQENNVLDMAKKRHTKSSGSFPNSAPSDADPSQFILGSHTFWQNLA